MRPHTFCATVAMLFLGMTLLPLGGCHKWVSPPPGISIANTFVGHINADRYQEAYDMTLPAFRANVTKKQFEEFCKRRNLTRERPEILEPDRKKFPDPGGGIGVYDHRLLPFSVGLAKGEDGQWWVDTVILNVMDETLLKEMEYRRNGNKSHQSTEMEEK